MCGETTVLDPVAKERLSRHTQEACRCRTHMYTSHRLLKQGPRQRVPSSEPSVCVLTCHGALCSSGVVEIAHGELMNSGYSWRTQWIIWISLHVPLLLCVSASTEELLWHKMQMLVLTQTNFVSSFWSASGSTTVRMWGKTENIIRICLWFRLWQSNISIPLSVSFP